MSLFKRRKRATPRPTERSPEDGQPVLTVHFGDLHVGSSLALWPPDVPLADGGSWKWSDLQDWYWPRWVEFWEDTARLKAEYGAWVVGISGGDERDGDHHGTAQLVSADEDDQDQAVEKVLEVAAPVVDEWIFVRGTPSHGAATERYARDAAMRGWNVRGNGERWSHWVYTGEHGGVRMEVAHTPGTNSWVPTTRGPAVARHAQYTKAEYNRSGIEPPDVVIRHHVHYWQGPGCDGPTCCFFIPGWQAASNWIFSRGVKSAANSEFVQGGLRLLCEAGAWRHFWWLRAPKSRVSWAMS